MAKKKDNSSISYQLIEEIEKQIKEKTNINEFKKIFHQKINNKILEWLK